MGAEAVESGNLHFASIIAMRLKKILSDQENYEDNTVNRLASYFTQGLLQKCSDASSSSSSANQTNYYNAMSSTFQILLQELSPYVKFAHFTANQAILEVTHGEGQQDIHVLDFDIMEGMQWPSLMVDLITSRQDASLRITAIFADKGSSASVQKTGFRLQEFASSINLPFFFDQILFTIEDDLEQIKPEARRTLIANICMVNQLHVPLRGNLQLKTFLNGLRKLSPKAVVLAEEELFNMCRAPLMSFVEFSSEAFQHYSAMSDSLLSGFSKGYKSAQRLVEKEFLSRRILDCLKVFPSAKEKRNLWKENYPSMNGFTPIPMSSYNVTQAKHLISLFDGGYWVQHEQCRLTLWWKSRPLTTASVWVPTATSDSKDVISLNS